MSIGPSPNASGNMNAGPDNSTSPGCSGNSGYSSADATQTTGNPNLFWNAPGVVDGSHSVRPSTTKNIVKREAGWQKNAVHFILGSSIPLLMLETIKSAARWVGGSSGFYFPNPSDDELRVALRGSLLNPPVVFLVMLIFIGLPPFLALNQRIARPAVSVGLCFGMVLSLLEFVLQWGAPAF